MIEFLLTTRSKGFLAVFFWNRVVSIYFQFVKLYEQANSKIQIQDIDRMHRRLITTTHTLNFYVRTYIIDSLELCNDRQLI